MSTAKLRKIRNEVSDLNRQIKELHYSTPFAKMNPAQLVRLQQLTVQRAELVKILRNNYQSSCKAKERWMPYTRFQRVLEEMLYCKEGLARKIRTEHVDQLLDLVNYIVDNAQP